MTSRPAILEMPARTAARKVTAQFIGEKPRASGAPRLARLPSSGVLEPTGSQTIIGIGVGQPDAMSTSSDHQAPTRKLVAVRAAPEQPTTVWPPASPLTCGTARAGLVPGLVPAPEQRAAPTLLGKTPVLERDVFQLARRIALQADLLEAMRVLRHGLSRLTDSSDATCVFFDAALCSAWEVPDGSGRPGLDDQLQQLVAWVASSGQRAVLGHALIEPVGLAPARAVFVIRRPPTSAVYGDLEIATVTAIAAAVVGLIGHFVVEHVARREQARRNARSPLRPAAPPSATAALGCVVPTARTWTRWAYPTLVGLIAAMIAAAATIQVPTYSTGVSTITVEGEPVTSLMPGTVSEVLVAPGAQVTAGTPVVRLRALEEAAELAASEADHRDALAASRERPGDDSAHNALDAAATRWRRAKAIVEGHTLRAPSAGIVSDIRVRPGQLVTPGAPIMRISPRAEPSVVALLPGSDRPRLEAGMTLQLELSGRHSPRAQAVIDAIDSQVIGPEEVRRRLGDPIGDALPVNAPVVIVRAHLTARASEAGGRAYEFHDGVLGKAEVEIDHQSLLRVLLHGKGK